MSSILLRWNDLPAAEAEAEILPCNGSHAWARGLCAERPFEGELALLESSDKVWLALDHNDWLEAFGTHPRIGERDAQTASRQALTWSETEQQASEAGEVYEANLLVELNREYEAKFGRVFLICATGRSKREILEVLRARMSSTDAEEMDEAAAQQKQITQLRLTRWLRGE